MAHLVISNRPIEHANYFANPESLYTFLSLHGKGIDTLIFAFWSWKVEKWMLDAYKCFGMHTGPLLEGRGLGGSPIDNLKALGVKITTVCAFEMTEKLDCGKIKLAIPLDINVSKTHVVYRISQMLPLIVRYLTAKQPDIPLTFKRIQNVK